MCNNIWFPDIEKINFGFYQGIILEIDNFERIPENFPIFDLVIWMDMPIYSDIFASVMHKSNPGNPDFRNIILANQRSSALLTNSQEQNLSRATGNRLQHKIRANCPFREDPNTKSQVGKKSPQLDPVRKLHANRRGIAREIRFRGNPEKLRFFRL